MTALTKPDSRAVAAHQPPPMSGWLRDAVSAAMSPHPDIGSGRAEVPAVVRAEAARILPSFDALLAPATVEDWHRFLRPLAYLPGAPKDREEMARACAMVAFAMPDLPASQLTTNRQSEALRRFTFWPKPAELHEWLGPEARPLRAQRNAVASVASAGQPQARRPERTPEEIAAVAAKAATFATEMRALANASSSGQSSVQPRHLAPQDLLESYERQAREGGPLAAVARLRVGVLRRQLGLEEAECGTRV